MLYNDCIYYTDERWKHMMECYLLPYKPTSETDIACTRGIIVKV